MLPRALVDANIRFAPIESTLPGGRRLTDWLTATSEEVLIEDPGIRVLIRGTDEVLIDIDDGADTTLLGPTLYGAATRTLLLHGGTFCLHATIVRHGDAVVALGGHNGAGKSTTATALSRFHSAALLVDDLAPARVVDGRPQVCVFERPVHLTFEALHRLGLNDSDATVLIPGPKGKVAMPATRFGAEAGQVRWVELERLVVLSLPGDDAEDGHRDDRDASTGLTEQAVSGAERLRWVVRLSNVTGLAALGGRGADYFTWATSLADALDVVNIARPRCADTLPEVCAAVLAAMRP